MLLLKDSRMLALFFLVAAYNLTHLMAIQDRLLSKEIVQLDPVERFPRDESGGFAVASSSSVTESQSQEVASLSIPNRIKRAVGSAWEKINTFIFGTKPRLPDEKRAQIHKQLEANREEIMALRTEYENLGQSIQELEKQMCGKVRRRCKVTGRQDISGVFRKLERYHKIYTLTLVQDRIYKLGGIGARMSMIESTSPWPWTFWGKIKVGQVIPFVISYLRGVKQAMSHVGVPKHPSSIQDMGNTLEKTALIAKNLGERLQPEYLENKKQVGWILKHLTRLISRKTKQSPSTLSGDDLSSVVDKVQVGMVQDLRNILHSITFETREDYPQIDWRFEEMLSCIKNDFLKCSGFQVLEFLYKFGLITKMEVNSFFESKETLDLTARHLFDLFSDCLDPFIAYHSLIPDINFIINHWRTGHLKYLIELDEEKQSYLLYQLLKQASGDWFKRILNENETMPTELNGFEFFGEENFLQDIKNWSPKSWNSIENKPQDDLMRENLEKIIGLFISFPVLRISDFKLRLAFLINYYILQFTRTFGNMNIKSFIDAFANGKRNSRFLKDIYGDRNGQELDLNQFGCNEFEQQFDLIKCGLELRQLTNHSHDHQYLLSYPDNIIPIIPKWINQNSHEGLKKKIVEFEKGFWYKYKQIHEVSKTHDQMKRWIENKAVAGILELFNETNDIERSRAHLNVWLFYVTDHSSTEPIDPKECFELADHLSYYYNVQDKYSKFPHSQDSLEKLEEAVFLKYLGRNKKQLS